MENSTNPFLEAEKEASLNIHEKPTLKISRQATNPFDDEEEDDCNEELKKEEESPSPRVVAEEHSRRSSNPFDENPAPKSSSNNKMINPFKVKREDAVQTTAKTPSPMAPAPSVRRKSGLLSGKDPIDVSTLNEVEKDLIIMGISIKAAQETKQEDDLDSRLRILFRTAVSNENKRLNVWGSPFQVRITGYAVNDTGSKPFTEFTVSVMPRGSNTDFIVKRRYSQFCSLHDSLKKEFQTIAPNGLQFAFVDSRYQMFRPTDESRKEMLNAWLLGIALDPNLILNRTVFEKVTNFLDYFIHVDKNEIIRGISVPTLFR